MSLTTVRIVGAFSGAISLLLLFLGAFAQSLALWCGIPGLVLFLGTGIFLLIFWRCPSCRTHLPLRTHFLTTEFCPCCGQNLHLQ